MSRRKIRQGPTWEITPETFTDHGYPVPEKLPTFGIVEITLLMKNKKKMAEILKLFQDGKRKGDPEWDAVFRVDQTM